MPPPVFRFAPSPNGFLHLGHAFSALLNFESARRSGGRFLLRIEDIDATRCRPEFETAIYEDLAWLGIAWETPVRRQSEHLADYRDGARPARRAWDCSIRVSKAAPRLRAGGSIAKRWRLGRAIPMARRSIPARRNRFRPTERERLLRSGAPLCVAAGYGRGVRAAPAISHGSSGADGPDGETGEVAARPEVWGDVILARKETPTSYHLSVVIDDALQGVTDVVRGQDLFWSTARAPAAAKNAGLAAAGLPPSPSDPRWRRAEAVEVDRGDRVAGIARPGRDARRRSAAWSACLNLPQRSCLVRRKHRRTENASGVTLRAGPWHGGAGGARESWRRHRAHRAARGRLKRRPAKKRVPKKSRSREDQAASAQSASGMVEAALAAFAHEVRTPLTGILAISDLLATSDLGERERRWVDTIKAGAEHLASLATLFVDAARSRTSGARRCGRISSICARWRATPAIRWPAARRPRACARAVEISDKLPAFVIGDPVRLRAALENLIDNAVKFTEQGGVVLKVTPLRGGRRARSASPSRFPTAASACRSPRSSGCSGRSRRPMSRSRRASAAPGSDCPR